jgi:hypothetical protein
MENVAVYATSTVKVGLLKKTFGGKNYFKAYH